MLIFQCSLCLQSQGIELKNAFSQEDIPEGEQVFTEIPRDFKNDGGQYDVVFRLKKGVYDQSKAAHIWYELFGTFFRFKFWGNKCGYLPIHF